MKYNEASYKQSHNSEDRNEDVHESLAFDYADPWNGGCCGLEYDVWRHSDDSNGRSLGYFTVAHSTSSGPPFANYLGQLLSWDLSNINHDIVFVTVDIKSSRGSIEEFPDEIDNYLRRWFNEGILFTPGQLSPRSDKFVAYVRDHGWPELDALRGKFLFCLSGNEKWKSSYAETNPTHRLCFADAGFDDKEKIKVPEGGQRVIYSSNLFNKNSAIWKQSVASLRAANLITRGFILNGESLWDNARQARLNVFVTDKITGHSWAHVGSKPFVRL